MSVLIAGSYRNETHTHNIFELLNLRIQNRLQVGIHSISLEKTKKSIAACLGSHTLSFHPFFDMSKSMGPIYGLKRMHNGVDPFCKVSCHMYKNTSHC